MAASGATGCGASPTEDRILDAAERCLRRFGLRRASMGDVAREAGLSRASLYRYFADRDALVEAVLERAAERFVASSRPALARRRTLAAQIGEAAAFIRTHLRGELVSLRLPADEETLLAALLTARVRGLVARWIEFWQPWLAEAAARGEIRPDLDLREAGEWVVRMLLSIAVMPSAAVDLDDPAAVRAFVQTYAVQGLAPAPGRRRPEEEA